MGLNNLPPEIKSMVRQQLHFYFDNHKFYGHLTNKWIVNYAMRNIRPASSADLNF